MAGYRPVGCPASDREPFRVRNLSALVRSGNRLAYSRSNWSMRSVWLRSAWREPWEERLLTGRVQVAQLALQCLIVQLMGIKAELPRHGRPFHPILRLAADHAAPGRLAGRPGISLPRPWSTSSEPGRRRKAHELHRRKPNRQIRSLGAAGSQRCPGKAAQVRTGPPLR